MEEKQGYGQIPNTILFDSSLSPLSRLIFIYISSLCAQRGYCWASNAHIAEKFGVSTSKVSRSIKQLDKYLDISNPHNEKRTICLGKNASPPRQKRLSSLGKNASHNTIKNRTSIKGVEYSQSVDNYLAKWYPDKRRSNLKEKP